MLPATSGLSNRDLALLAWIGEQYGARIDHLQTLTGFGASGVRTIVRRMRRAELVRTERIVALQPAWAIPSAGGLAVCGLPYGVWTPVLGRLTHVAAVNDVRLHVQTQRPDSEWLSERQLEWELAKSARRGRHTPDGVLRLEGREVAIEVELSLKRPEGVEAVLNHHARRFDAIMYYCAPQTIRLLTRLEKTGRWPKLAVRELPQPRYLRER
jgi:hypothetical protein